MRPSPPHCRARPPVARLARSRRDRGRIARQRAGRSAESPLAAPPHHPHWRRHLRSWSPPLWVRRPPGSRRTVAAQLWGPQSSPRRELLPAPLHGPADVHVHMYMWLSSGSRHACVRACACMHACMHVTCRYAHVAVVWISPAAPACNAASRTTSAPARSCLFTGRVAPGTQLCSVSFKGRLKGGQGSATS